MSLKGKLVYEFGPFRFDPSEYRLLREGQPVLLTPKAFETLLVLIENAGHVVGKDDLMKRVWPDAIVEESTISQNIFTLRKVLGATTNEHPFIETVPKHGYRLAVPVRELFDEVSKEPKPALPQQAEGFPVTAQLRPRPRRWVVIGVLGLTAILAVSMGFGRWTPSITDRLEPFHTMSITRLTDTGKSVEAAISPDGKFVAHAVDDGAGQGLWVRLVEAGRDVEIVPSTGSSFQGLTFSPDGSRIYYVRGTVLYEVSVLGGNSHKLLADVDGPVTISPDGNQFGFVRDDLNGGESAVMISNADGTGAAKLATRRLPQHFRSVAWSPRGDTLVAAVGSRAGEMYMTLTEIAVKTGVETPVTSFQWHTARRVEWTADGNGLILSASAQASEPLQLWYVSYPRGEVRRITNDLTEYSGPTLTADSQKLVSPQRTELSNIWLAGDSGRGRAIPITLTEAHADRPSWAPDGTIVYESQTSGNRDLWSVNADGSNARQLTFDAATDTSPTVSPGGDTIYFVSGRSSGVAHIWKMDRDGTNLKQLTDADGELTPDCSPDGTWLVYVSTTSGRPVLWRVSTAGGAPVQLTKKLSRSPSISPDGKRIAFYYWDELPESPIRLAIIPSSGGEPEKLFDFPGIIPTRFVRWSADGQALTYVVTQNGVSNIWRQPIDGTPPKPITRFESDRIGFFDWSRSGKQLVFSRLVRTENIVLMTNFGSR